MSQDTMTKAYKREYIAGFLVLENSMTKAYKRKSLAGFLVSDRVHDEAETAEALPHQKGSHFDPQAGSRERHIGNVQSLVIPGSLSPVTQLLQ